MTRDEKRKAIISAAADTVDREDLGGRQLMLTAKLAKEINKFISRNKVELHLMSLILDWLAEEMCVGVYDEAEKMKEVVM